MTALAFLARGHSQRTIDERRSNYDRLILVAGGTAAGAPASRAPKNTKKRTSVGPYNRAARCLGKTFLSTEEGRGFLLPHAKGPPVTLLTLSRCPSGVGSVFWRERDCVEWGLISGAGAHFESEYEHTTSGFVVTEADHLLDVLLNVR